MRRRRAPRWLRRAIPASRPPTVARQPLVPRAGAWDGGGARPAPSDWLRASGRRSAIGPRGCLARGRSWWGGGGWKLLEVRGRGGRGQSGARAGTRGRGGAGARRGRGGAEGGPSGSPPPAPPRPRPARSDRGRPGGRRAGRFPVLGVARLSRGRAARAAGAPGRPWPPPAPRAPPCCSPSATPCSCPSTRYPRRPRWHRALAAPSAAVCHPRGTRDPGRGLGRGRREEATRLLLSAWRPLPPPPQLPTQPPPRPGSPGGLRAPTCARACLALLPATAAPDPGRACTA